MKARQGKRSIEDRQTQDTSSRKFSEFSEPIKSINRVKRHSTPKAFVKKQDQKQQVQFPALRQQDREDSELSIKRTQTMIKTVADELQKNILEGGLVVEQNASEFQLKKNDKETENSESKKQMSPQQHKENIRKFKKLGSQFRKQLNKSHQEISNKIKQIHDQEQQLREESRKLALEERRKSIQQRMKSKSEMMMKIRQQCRMTDSNVKEVKKRIKAKSFLYQQYQESFKEKYIVPSIIEQNNALNRRKQLMKTIDIKQLLNHEKNYQNRIKMSRINRSYNSRVLEPTPQYKPPEFVPKAFLTFDSQNRKKKQEEQLKEKKKAQIKLKKKQYLRKLQQIRKNKNSPSRSRSTLSPPTKDGKHKVSMPRQSMSRDQLNNVGNDYFRTFKAEAQQIKRLNDLKVKQRQEEKLRRQQEQQRSRNPEKELQLLRIAQQEKRIEKHEKTQRIQKLRSRRIQGIFNDKRINSIEKYDKLENQIQKIDMTLKVKNHNSQDPNERSQVASYYIDSIKAKIQLLKMNN